MLERGTHPSVQENLQPRAWLTRAVNASIQTETVPTSLLLPNGFPVLRLQIEVTLWHHKGMPQSVTFDFCLHWVVDFVCTSLCHLSVRMAASCQNVGRSCTMLPIGL
jgi:hypothetical protein